MCVQMGMTSPLYKSLKRQWWSHMLPCVLSLGQIPIGSAPGDGRKEGRKEGKKGRKEKNRKEGEDGRRKEGEKGQAQAFVP